MIKITINNYQDAQYMDYYFQIMTGYISDLKIFNNTETFLEATKTAGLTETDILKIGNMNQVHELNLIRNRNPELTEKDNLVQFFQCKLGNNIIEGVFSRVYFHDGDYVEMVVDPIQDGNYFAYAVRRPKDCHLWLHPFATEGSESMMRYSSFWDDAMIIISISLVIPLICLIMEVGNNPLFLISLSLISVLLSLHVYRKKKSYKHTLLSKTQVAEKIFRTLGYQTPEKVDLIKDEREYFYKKFNALFDDYIENYFDWDEEDIEERKKYANYNEEGLNCNSFDTPAIDRYEILKEFIEIYKNEVSSDDNERDKLVKHFLREVPSEGVSWVVLYHNAPLIPSYIKKTHTENSIKTTN